MVKIFKPKFLTPREVLDQVHKSGVIDYIFSWGYTIDENRNTITFNLRYTGGDDEEKEKKMMRELDNFIRAIDEEIKS